MNSMSCRHVRGGICLFFAWHSAVPTGSASEATLAARQRFRSASASPLRSRAARHKERFGTDPGLTMLAPGSPIMPASVRRIR